MSLLSNKARKGLISEGRMPCPDCSANIRLPLQSLYSGQPIFCTSCGLKLSVDFQASKGALDALTKAQSVLGAIDQANQTLEGYATKVGRGRS
jgi:uncharacterized paraquat-inducible protein A